LRLPGYDYAQPGAYFVTAVVLDRACLFGTVSNCNVVLNDLGNMVQFHWEALSGRFPSVSLDVFIVMPNHLHGILVITGDSQRRGPDAGPRGAVEELDTRPGVHRPALSAVVGAFKSLTSRAYARGSWSRDISSADGRLWQRNFFEHVIRDDNDLQRVRQYITDNPAVWDMDDENPRRRR
jgi:putative transposase